MVGLPQTTALEAAVAPVLARRELRVLRAPQHRQHQNRLAAEAAVALHTRRALEAMVAPVAFREAAAAAVAQAQLLVEMAAQVATVT